MSTQGTGRRDAVLLVGLLFAQLLLMSGSVQGGDGATVLENWTMTVTGPVVRAAQFVGGSLRGVVTGSTNLIGANRRRAQLEQEVEQLRAEVQLRREATLENRRLRRLLGMRDELVGDAIAADVVTFSLSGRGKLIVLNRGTRDGVHVDLPVVAFGGAVGRVVAANASFSKVRLLTDPNSGVAGVVQRSRAQGIVVGRADDPLDLQHVPRFEDVVDGDQVVTSALDGIFPVGFSIGEVIGIDETPGGRRTIRLAPGLEYRGLEEVLVLRESAGGGMVTPPGLVEDR